MANGFQASELSALPERDVVGWVLYDGTCGVCRTWVPRWLWLLHRRQLDIAALQEDWVIARLGLSEEERMRDVRLLFRDGGSLAGAEVYRYVARHTWWLWPLFAISVLPGLRQLCNMGYRKFADNRYKISQTCRIR